MVHGFRYNPLKSLADQSCEFCLSKRLSRARNTKHLKPTLLYQYHAIRYVPDMIGGVGITLALLALSDSQPSFLALKQLPSWVPVLKLDAEADIILLNAFLNELSGAIRLDSQYINRAMQWENSIRIMPPQEFLASDFECAFANLANVEFSQDHSLFS